MALSPHSYVTYEARPDSLGRSHSHLVPMGDGRVCVLETEEACELLAEAVENCNTDRHDGHGTKHGSDEPEKAYKAGIEQLMTKDFEAEWQVLQRRIMLRDKWGGQPPEAVLFPTQDDPDKWKIVLPDRQTGAPVVYDVKEKALKGIVPTPEQAGAVPDKEGIGFRRKRRVGSAAKAKRIHDKRA
mgnify:FL=1